MKSTELESFQRDRGIYEKRVRFTSKASIGNIGVFSLIETGKEQYMVRKANFKLVSECNWKNTGKISVYPVAIRTGPVHRSVFAIRIGSLKSLLEIYMKFLVIKLP